MKGYVQVYTGNGKGKTTASLGLAIRAAGAGMSVYIAQFLKQGDYSEILSLERFKDLIKVEQFGMGRFVKGRPSDEDAVAAERGYQRLEAVLKEGGHDLVIIEEGNVAVSLGLFSEERLIELIDLRKENVEVVITGRNAGKKLIEKADLVTEMTEIKHYYKDGVKARIGIEK